ncbi:MAG: GNAT family N-acetyltransferase [Clostridiaceae bacterium]|nr:GNAT family N-acetyltransferase [Clostridiaceae bacterium]
MFNLETFTLYNHKPKAMTIRNYTKEDFEAIMEMEALSYPPPFPKELLWDYGQLESHTKVFPLGCICAEIDNKIVGALTTMIINYDPEEDPSWDEVTNYGYIKGNHTSKGDTLYVVDINVHSDYRHYNVGIRMIQSAYYLVVKLDLDRLLGCGRMPEYYKYVDELEPEEYIEGVIEGEIKDPVISFMFKCGRRPVKIISNYVEDKKSCDYACLMEWRNPFKNVTKLEQQKFFKGINRIK